MYTCVGYSTFLCSSNAGTSVHSNASLECSSLYLPVTFTIGAIAEAVTQTYKHIHVDTHDGRVAMIKR